MAVRTYSRGFKSDYGSIEKFSITCCIGGLVLHSITMEMVFHTLHVKIACYTRLTRTECKRNFSRIVHTHHQVTSQITEVRHINVKHHYSLTHSPCTPTCLICPSIKPLFSLLLQQQLDKLSSLFSYPRQPATATSVSSAQCVKRDKKNKRESG